MKILITGIPGVGKSEISKALAKKLKYKVINDKHYSKKKKLGEMEDKEYVVDIDLLNKQFSKDKNFKDVIFEGHLWCELSKTNLKLFDKIIVLTTDKKTIRERLEKRKYSLIKIEENIYCMENKYIQDILSKKNSKYIIIKINKNITENIKKICDKLW